MVKALSFKWIGFLLAFGLTSTVHAGNAMTNLEIVKSTYQGNNAEENNKIIRFEQFVDSKPVVDSTLK